MSSHDTIEQGITKGCPYCLASDICPRTDMERALTADRDRLAVRLAECEKERNALKLHYDAASPEHNLLALLDSFMEREHEAERQRDEYKRLYFEAIRKLADALRVERDEWQRRYDESNDKHAESARVYARVVAERDEVRQECERLREVCEAAARFAALYIDDADPDGPEFARARIGIVRAVSTLSPAVADKGGTDA